MDIVECIFIIRAKGIGKAEDGYAQKRFKPAARFHDFIFLPVRWHSQILVTESMTADLPACRVDGADLIGGHIMGEPYVVVDNISHAGEAISLHDRLGSRVC